MFLNFKELNLLKKLGLATNKLKFGFKIEDINRYFKLIIKILNALIDSI